MIFLLSKFFWSFFISIFSLIKVLQSPWIVIKDFHYKVVFLFMKKNFLVCSLWYPFGCQSDNLRWTLVRYMWSWKLDLFAALNVVPCFVKTFIQSSGKLFWWSKNWYQLMKMHYVKIQIHRGNILVFILTYQLFGNKKNRPNSYFLIFGIEVGFRL